MSDEEKSRLAVEERARGFAIGYYFPYTGDFGMMLGQDKAILRLYPDVAREWSGLLLETAAQAKKALAAAKTAIKALDGSQEHWPEWARLAAAAGWKAPKGWKP